MSNGQAQQLVTPSSHPTLRGANLLYLLAMVLVVALGSAMQVASFTWGLIGTQVLLLLLPALLFLRLMRLPARETLRWRGLSPWLALLSIIIGASIWLLAAWLEGVLSALFGYSVWGLPNMYPTNASQAALTLAALAVAAPICEEIFFRGVIQRAYERLGARWAVVLGGLLFALFHLRLSGLVALIPISLALGYVVWRSNSLWAGILMHAANNALAAGLLISASLRPEQWERAAVPVPLAAAGGAIAALGLWLFRRLTAPEAPAAPPEGRSLFGWAWPLSLALALFVALGAAEFVVGRQPQALAFGQELAFQEAPWDAPLTWRYELRNVLDDPVGSAECALMRQEDAFALACQIRQEAFEAQVGRSFWSSDEATWRTMAVWAADGLALTEAQGTRESAILPYAYQVTRDADALRLAAQWPDATEELALPPSTLLAHEWPWRLAALPFSTAYAREAALARPLAWRPATEDNGPDLREALVTIRGATPLAAPWGNAVAWFVEVADQKAWYDADPPHHLLRYDDGFHTWVLVEVR